MASITIDLQLADAGKPHWLNADARCAVASGYLNLLEEKALGILNKPAHIRTFDPMWATTSRGEFLHHVFAQVVESIPERVRRRLTLPEREKWDLSDLGGGITRQQLRDLLEDIDAVRTVLGSQGAPTRQP